MKARVASLLVLALVGCLVAMPLFTGKSGGAASVGQGQTPWNEEGTWDAGEYFQHVRDQAARAAENVFGSIKERYKKATEDLIPAHPYPSNHDVVLVFNSGGWGNTPFQETGAGWDTVVQGIQSWLTGAGYTYVLVENNRCENSLWDIMRELKEFLTARYSEARGLAEEIQSATQLRPDLRVILIGESAGAMFSSEVMQPLDGNTQVFSIQAGRPFWYKGPPNSRTLSLDGNGMVPDSMTSGDLWAMFRHNFLRLAGIFRPGSFVRLDKSVEAPGHNYSWEYPDVRAQVETFLQTNFGPHGL